MVMMIMNFSSLRNMLSVRRLLDVNMRGIHFSFKVALNDEQRNRCFWSCDLSIVDDFRGEGQFQCFDNSEKYECLRNWQGISIRHLLDCFI